MTTSPDWGAVDRWRLRATWAAVLESLPTGWEPRLRRLVDDAAAAVPVWHRASTAREVLSAWSKRFPGLAQADLTHAEIAQQAEGLAARADELGMGRVPAEADPWPEWSRVCAWVERHHGAPPKPRGDQCMTRQLVALAKRVRCPRWWRRQLRRHVARTAEAAAVELGIVSAVNGQLYCSDRALKRRQEQQRANEEALKAHEIENGNGQRFTMWDVMQRGVGNKAVRRGELMTRIRGAEELADEMRLDGKFWTLTAPSRYHSRDHRTGLRNPRYVSGLSPRDAQLWLRATWAKTRTRLKDHGARVMGVRVAEPHHDGCPHWHLLIWCEPEKAELVRDVITRAWLEDEGDEPGAKRHRAKWMQLRPGGAAGYVAKYISKNIDAPLFYAGQAVYLDHVDDEPPDVGTRGDLLGTAPVTPEARVEAWASAWGIRQFQTVGMPSVTVWRELRRVHANAIEGRGDSLLAEAWRAAHRHGARRADWAGYCRAQGGVMLKRTEYRARLKLQEVERVGGYDEGLVNRCPVGVTTDQTEAVHNYAPSARQPWGGAGFSARVRAAWTGLNKCGPDGRRLHRYVNGEPWRFGRAAWESRPPPGPAYFGDRTPFQEIADQLEASIKAGREGRVLPALDEARPAVAEVAPPRPLADLAAELQARAVRRVPVEPLAVVDRPETAPAGASPVPADRIAALKARLAARAGRSA